MCWPALVVRLMKFGDSALEFELRVWSETQVRRKGVLTGAINLTICDKFRVHKIEISFPQRDLHIRSGAVETRLADAGRTASPLKYKYK